MAVILPDNLIQPPEPHEIEVARILSHHFRVDVTFLVPVNTYKRKTPDIEMKNIEWEIKSPTGKSKKQTVSNQVASASRQSKFIIIDGRRSRLTDTFTVKALTKEMNIRRSIKRIIYIDKSHSVNEIYKSNK